MFWTRLGLALPPQLSPGGIWKSHFQMPILEFRSGSQWRLYFTGRDKANKSHGFYALLDINTPSAGAAGYPIISVISAHLAPIICPGANGTFDADGAMPSSIIKTEDATWLYYQGWIKRNDVPFQTAIGLAVSKDGGRSFDKLRDGPILGKAPGDPYSTASPLVVRDKSAYKMFYSSIQTWSPFLGNIEPRYPVKMAHSRDGIDWRRLQDTAIELKDEDEGGISRPSIIIHRGVWHMWYSYRGWKNYRDNPATAYRLGYATSVDGRIWRRRDNLMEFSNPPQLGDWDYVMQAYPAVMQCGNSLLCFYSGNGFGKEGIGYAILEGGLEALEIIDQ